MVKESGQITVEAVLILTLLVSASVLTSKEIKSRQFLPKLVESPWSYIQGMIENGVWMSTDVGKGKHPNHISRHGSPRGDTP